MTRVPASYALYVHVPWCRHVCPYCDFNVYAAAAVPEADEIPAYRAELASWAARAEWRGRPIATVYLGGGTPSLLSPDAVGAVLDAVRQVGLCDGAEVTLEANPGTLDRARLEGYRAAGVTRLSLGAQSFQPALLRTLGRDHAAGDSAAAVAAARAAGFTNVSLDLIFAVPGETLAAWEDDLARALALAPDHISAYALTWEEATPFHAWRARGRLVAVDDDLESAMADMACDRLAAAGLARYEISSWARPGFASRHNTRYWDGSDYLGIGPGAHSFHAGPPTHRWWNVRIPHRWGAAVSAAGTAIEGEEHLTEAQARSDFVIAGLRRIAGVDATGFRQRFAIDLRAAFPQLVRLEQDCLVELRDARLRLTSRGLRYADTVGALLV